MPEVDFTIPLIIVGVSVVFAASLFFRLRAYEARVEANTEALLKRTRRSRVGKGSDNADHGESSGEEGATEEDTTGASAS